MMLSCVKNRRLLTAKLIFAALVSVLTMSNIPAGAWALASEYASQRGPGRAALFAVSTLVVLTFVSSLR
jgi:hypothetical protein